MISEIALAVLAKSTILHRASSNSVAPRLCRSANTLRCYASSRCGASARPAMTIALPHWLARIGSHACDLLHVTPFSFGHLQLMQHDNVPHVNHLPQLLQVTERTQGR